VNIAIAHAGWIVIILALAACAFRPGAGGMTIIGIRPSS
jgi:hypothetical protein